MASVFNKNHYGGVRITSINVSQNPQCQNDLHMDYETDREEGKEECQWASTAENYSTLLNT